MIERRRRRPSVYCGSNKISRVQLSTVAHYAQHVISDQLNVYFFSHQNPNPLFYHDVDNSPSFEHFYHNGVCKYNEYHHHALCTTLAIEQHEHSLGPNIVFHPHGEYIFHSWWVLFVYSLARNIGVHLHVFSPGIKTPFNPRRRILTLYKNHELFDKLCNQEKHINVDEMGLVGFGQ